MILRENDRPIGIFDSGLGGLTVLREIHQLLPQEDIIYFGDSGRMPYGTKSKETVIRYTFQDIHFLLTHHVKMIVIACNTASSCSLPQVIAKCDVPVVEVIGPGSRAAADATVNKKIAVIGTPATIGSGVYRTALKNIMPDLVYFGQACPLFVPLAEEGWWDNEIAKAVAAEYLHAVAASGSDTLILGCTHYPLLIPAIRAVLGDTVFLVNSALAVANEVRFRLRELHLSRESDPNRTGKMSFYTSDSADKFAGLGSIFLGQPLEDVRKIEIEEY